MTQNTSVGYIPVPTTRTVNSKALSTDVTLDASDVGAVPTSRTVNSKALSTDISLTPADVGAQPADATLTALAGVTSDANKLPYFTGEDQAGVTDITALARSLLGSTTEAAAQAVLKAASSTTATQAIYVDKAATGTGTGVDWTNAFTTIQAAVNSLPAVINHAVTIIIREGATPYNESITIQRVVAAGSITLRGEYYWNNSIASAGSSAGKFNVNASDTGIQAGDKVLLMKYTGTVGSSRPDDAFVDTVASVVGTEVTLTTRTSDTFTTSWRYVIARTEIKSLVIQSHYVTVQGVYLNGGTTPAYVAAGIIDPKISACIFESTTDTTAHLRNCVLTTSQGISWLGVVCRASQNNGLVVSGTDAGFGVTQTNIAVISGAVAYGSGRGHIYCINSSLSIYYVSIKGLSGGTANGIMINGGVVGVGSATIDGFDASNKLPIGVSGINGGTGLLTSVTFGSNVTTQKSPANWAATTDGSYIS